MINTKNIRKKQRLKIDSIDSFKEMLIEEGYEEFELIEENFKVYLSNTLNIDSETCEMIYKLLNEESITYKVDNIKDFIEYIKNMRLYKLEYERLKNIINQINKLNIDRVEYEREVCIPDEIDHIVDDIEKIKSSVSSRISNKEVDSINKIEKQIDKDYVYAKDIELLKKIVLSTSSLKQEKYNEETKTKTLSIMLTDEIDHSYIPADIGSVEYHNHLKINIPRMKRLSKNLNKYMKPSKIEQMSYNINQSEALNDTINIAMATYNNIKFKAISGSNEIEKFCSSPKEGKSRFISHKVNKLGKLGVGYNRVNDSEKKLIEEINRQIELGKLKDSGELTIYSKWEPCPSCYYVISQFCKLYPKINVEVKYMKKYGEQ